MPVLPPPLPARRRSGPRGRGRFLSSSPLHPGSQHSSLKQKTGTDSSLFPVGFACLRGNRTAPCVSPGGGGGIAGQLPPLGAPHRFQPAHAVDCVRCDSSSRPTLTNSAVPPYPISTVSVTQGYPQSKNHYVENSRKKQFINSKLLAILNSVTPSHTILLQSARGVNLPSVQLASVSTLCTLPAR